MRTLHIKLLRNLWTLKGQGLAIAAVIAAGVAMYVMSLTTLDSLRLSQESVYTNQRFAELFASLKRAPESVANRLRDIPGLAMLETRVVAPLNMQMADYPEPVTGLAISIPDGEQPQFNQLFLRAGQLPESGQDDQIVISEAFAEAHQLKPGDALAVVINGRYQELLISGLALSPEYIYQIRPGDILPDFARYAIVWMNRQALEAAYDMDGAFNNVVAAVSPGSSAQRVIVAMDLILEPWGGLGAYSQENQLSHRYLEQELASIEAMATFLPIIFIGVAAFLLNVVAARLIRTQREQIAVLKAFGYGSLSIVTHYLLLVLAVVLIGSVFGVLLGVWLASGMAGMYQEYYRFPWLIFRLRPEVAISAVLIAGGATVLGTLGAVLRAFRLPPAEAMRPEPPARYHRTLIERLGVKWLSQPARMILRNLERQPVKATLSIVGIGFAVAMMMLTGFQRGAVDHMLNVQFGLAQRQDATVTFVEPTNYRALHELRSLPGVAYAESFRSAPAILRYGHQEYRSAIQGYPLNSQLFSILDHSLQPVPIPEEGVMLTDHLARMLGVEPGDHLQVSIQEGRRPELSIPVAGLVTEFIGVGAYMHQGALNRMLREGDVISGAFITVEPGAEEELNNRLEDTPRVASVVFQGHTAAAFNEMMDETILVFTLFSMGMAGCIAFAVVYNNARIAFAERGRELASLRVLGFTKLAVAYILIGELLLLAVAAIPLGFLLGLGLSWMLIRSMQTDLFRVPLIMTPETFATSAITVLVATLLSSIIIARALAKLDMVSALKAAE